MEDLEGIKDVKREETFELKETGEEGIQQIKALLGLSELVTNVNIPNQGQIPNLPLGVVVETNALFRKDRVEPIMAGDIPHPIYGMVATHVSNQEALVKAGLIEDKKLAFAAFVNDPLMSIPYSEAEALFEEMIENTRGYLGEGWNK